MTAVFRWTFATDHPDRSIFEAAIVSVLSSASGLWVAEVSRDRRSGWRLTLEHEGRPVLNAGFESPLPPAVVMERRLEALLRLGSDSATNLKS